MALADEIQTSSKWLIKAFKELNLKLDYSVHSIRYLDNLLDAQFTNGKPHSKGIMAENTGPKLFAMSAYIGEVVLRNTSDCEWVLNDNDPQGDANIKIVSSKGVEMYPAQQLRARLHNPKGESLYEYVHTAVNAHMKSAKDVIRDGTPWWKFWSL